MGGHGGSAGFISYMPHNGISDQLRQLSIARALAARLNRVLVVPPLLSHFDATGKTLERVLATKIHRHRRPHLGLVLNLSKLGVPLADYRDLPPAFAWPACSNASAVQGIDQGQSFKTSPHCVLTVEPPPPKASAVDLIRSWARLSHEHVPWLHFRSMLWVQSERAAKRNPLSTWEEHLESGPCALQYREDVLHAARHALEPALPAAYLAIHVRALLEAGGKGERPLEWRKRLLSFVSSQLQRIPVSTGAPALSTVYVATDNETGVVPYATALLAPHNITVLSRSSTAAAALFAGGDDGIGGLLIDVAACLGAASLSPAPRSGLSVHLLAMRQCARGQPCEPHGCVAYTSTACGGGFPEDIVGAGVGAHELPARSHRQQVGSRRAAVVGHGVGGGRGPRSRYCQSLFSAVRFQNTLPL